MNSALPLKRILSWAALAAGAYGAVVFFYLAVLKLRYPYMVNLGEPALSQAVRLVSQGHLPYRDLHSPPFTLVPYGPVFLCLAAALKFVWASPFTGGRVVTAAATLGSAALIFVLSEKNGASKKVSALAALFFLSMPYVCRWGVLVNVDMTGVFLDLAAFYCWTLYADGNFSKPSFWIAGMALSVAAFFTKTSMLAAPAAFFWYLAVRKEFKKAFLLFFFEASAAALILAALNAATHGGYFFHTVFEISKRRFFPEFIFRFWKGALDESPVMAAAALAGIVLSLRGGKKVFTGLYAFFALLLTFSLGKQGSDTNYFLPLCAASAVSLGMILGFCDSAGGKKTGAVLAGSALYALLFSQLFLWVRPHFDLQASRRSYEKSREFLDHVSILVQKTHGDILSEDMSLLVANGKEIFYEPFPMGQMSYSGVWNSKPILEALEAQRFPMAILTFYAPLLKRNRTFTPEFMEAFNRRYRYVGRAEPPDEAKELTNTLYFYAPRRSA